MREIFKKYKICAILRGMETNKAIDTSKALYEGGIRLIEVAMNTECAASQIEKIKASLPGDFLIGAGTAITLQRAYDAVSAGASFLLTPSSNMKVLDFAAANKIMMLPGVMTPTDVDTCLSFGFDTLKLFPASDLPKTYIKSLKGPFSGTEYVAVGGVSPSNTPEYLNAGFIGVGIGSSLLPKDIEIKNIPAYINEFLRKVGL